ncbi:MAG: DUF3641 domain-containing protein [Giesbergeria sp.]
MTTLQVNLGYRCNQTCVHCHVNAGPNRTEMMDDAHARSGDRGAAGPFYPGARSHRRGAGAAMKGSASWCAAARALGVHVMDRCNLTILSEPGQEGLAAVPGRPEGRGGGVAALLLAGERGQAARRGRVRQQHRRPCSSSMPWVTAKPGSGLRAQPGLQPARRQLCRPTQRPLQADYKRELIAHFGIAFDELFVTHQHAHPALWLHADFQRRVQQLYAVAARQLQRAPTYAAVMCRSLVSVDWQGNLYDCDFNQQLGLPLPAGGAVRMAAQPHLRDLLAQDPAGRSVRTAEHCYGCTAGQGSSCGGALKGGMSMKHIRRLALLALVLVLVAGFFALGGAKWLTLDRPESAAWPSSPPGQDAVARVAVAGLLRGVRADNGLVPARSRHHDPGRRCDVRPGLGVCDCLVRRPAWALPLAFLARALPAARLRCRRALASG